MPTAGRLLGIYAAVRACLVLADVLAAHVSYGGNLDGPLQSWDAQWYLSVAAHGYPVAAQVANGSLTYSTAAFEPAFPALIRLLTDLGLPAIGAALVISVLGGAAAVLLVWHLVAELFDDTVAWRASVLFVLFPGMAISWGLAYSECIGLALAAGCLLLMVRERWLWAGAVGALATLTSPLALPLAVGALAEAIRSLVRREPVRAITAVVLVPVGFLGYAAWLGFRYHDAFFWVHLQAQAWGASLDFGRSWVRGLTSWWAKGYQGPGWLEWAGLAGVAAGWYAAWRSGLRLCLTAYCAGVTVLLLAGNSLGFKPRLLCWLFPLLVPVAARTSDRTFLALAIVFAYLLPVVFLAYTLLGNSMVQP